LNNQSGYETSTGKKTSKNYWGTTNYYTTYPIFPSTISPDGFNLSDWNGYTLAQQGSKANDTFAARDYGIQTNKGAWVINYNTAPQNFSVPSSSTWISAVQTAGTSITAKTIIANQTNSVQNFSITLSQSVSNASSSQLSSAWSESKTLAISAQISAQYEAMGAQFSSTLTESNTVSGTSTSSQSKSQTLSLISTLSTTVPAGFTYEYVLNYTVNKSGFGWSAPFTIQSGNIQWSANKSFVVSLPASNAAFAALDYGFPSDSLQYSSNSNEASGIFNGTSASVLNSEKKITSYVVTSPETPTVQTISSVSLGVDTPLAIRAADPTKPVPRPTPTTIGYSIKTNQSSQLLRGSNAADRLITAELGTNGQTLYGKQTYSLFAGDDYVSSHFTQDSVTLTLSGNKQISLGGGNDLIEAEVPGIAVPVKQYVSIDAGAGGDIIRFKNLSRTPLLFSELTLGSGKDTIEINLKDRGQAQFLFTDLEPGSDRIQLNGLKGKDLRFEAVPGGQLVGFYNDVKLLHFRSDFLGAASTRYSLNDQANKYEVAFLNFGFYALDSMPQTLTDLFVQFAGQSVTSLNNKLYTTWDQVKKADAYLTALTTKFVDLSAGAGISSTDRKTLIDGGIADAASSPSVSQWVNGISTNATALGITLTLPQGY
jgi:hypothetical protein